MKKGMLQAYNKKNNYGRDIVMKQVKKPSAMKKTLKKGMKLSRKLSTKKMMAKLKRKGVKPPKNGLRKPGMKSMAMAKSIGSHGGTCGTDSRPIAEGTPRAVGWQPATSTRHRPSYPREARSPVSSPGLPLLWRHLAGLSGEDGGEALVVAVGLVGVVDGGVAEEVVLRDVAAAHLHVRVEGALRSRRRQSGAKRGEAPKNLGKSRDFLEIGSRWESSI